MAMSIEDLTCKLACNDLLVRLCTALDSGDNDAAADCFAEDAVLELPAGEKRGPEVRAVLNARPASVTTRHVMTNVIVEPEGEACARGAGYILVYRVPTAADSARPLALPATPQAAGDWRISFVDTPRGWRISRYSASEVMVPAD